MFRPKQNRLNFEIKLPESADWNTKIAGAGLDTVDYSIRRGRYRLRLTKDDVKSKPEILKELVRAAYELKSS